MHTVQWLYYIKHGVQYTLRCQDISQHLRVRPIWKMAVTSTRTFSPVRLHCDLLFDVSVHFFIWCNIPYYGNYQDLSTALPSLHIIIIVMIRGRRLDTQGGLLFSSSKHFRLVLTTRINCFPLSLCKIPFSYEPQAKALFSQSDNWSDVGCAQN